jgi:predicted transcriptional regulator
MYTTSRTKTVLLTLLDLYQEFSRTIQLREITDATNLGRDIVRRELEILKCLELIESRHGSKGGFIPTIHAT